MLNIEVAVHMTASTYKAKEARRITLSGKQHRISITTIEKKEITDIQTASLPLLFTGRPGE